MGTKGVRAIIHAGPSRSQAARCFSSRGCDRLRWPHMEDAAHEHTIEQKILLPIIAPRLDRGRFALGAASMIGIALGIRSRAPGDRPDPAKDSTITAPLHEIVLTFSEAVTPAVVSIADQDGHPVKAVGALRADGATVHLPLTAPLPEGHYIVTWRVAAADTHVSNGTIPFAVAHTAP